MDMSIGPLPSPCNKGAPVPKTPQECIEIDIRNIQEAQKNIAEAATDIVRRLHFIAVQVEQNNRSIEKLAIRIQQLDEKLENV